MSASSVERFVLWIGFLAAGGLCLFLAYEDRTAAATVAGGLAAILIVFLYLPLMDSFEVFGLKAKLRERLAEAEGLTKLLRQTAATTSKLSLHQLAYADRWAHVSWQVKKQFVKDVEENLASHQVPKADIEAMKEPLLRFLTVDLLLMPYNIISIRTTRRQNEIDAEIRKLFPQGIDQADARYIELMEKRASLDIQALWSRATASDEIKNPRKLVSDMAAHLPSEDKNRLSGLIDAVCTLAEEIWSTRQLTDSAIQYLDAHPEPNGWRKQYEQAFGERP